jgi:hypothetical protein
MNLEPKYYATTLQGPARGPFTDFSQAVGYASQALVSEGLDEILVFGIATVRLRKPVEVPGDWDDAAKLRAAAAAALVP